MVNKPSNKKSPMKIKLSGVVALTVLAMCIVLLVAKGLFSSNDTDIPAGVYTGTINTNQTTVPPIDTIDNSTSESSASSESAADSDLEESTSAADSSADSTSTEDGEKAYVTEYANLHTEPSKDAENIVCMSPNVEVTVLEKLDNGYWKIYFVNVDGPTTGYLWNGYLQSEPLY